MKKKFIYLDYAASTPVDQKVQKAMLPFLRFEFGNPSSSHQLGQRAKAAVEIARERVAAFLGCSANDIIFTSGATEANNLAIQGILLNIAKENPLKKLHVITSTIEHESVLSPISELEKQKVIEVTYLPVDREGLVDIEKIKKALKKDTAIVSIQYANSEVGTIQPILEIGRMVKKHKALFHVDAVQAALYLDCSVEKLGIDMLTLSSHKIYGPKGVGALYIKKGILIHPLFYGGGQEQDIRSGTENVFGIVGMGEAIQEIQNPKSKIQNIRIRQLRDRFMKVIPQRISGVKITGSLKQRLFNNAHFIFKDIEGKNIVQLLDEKGIAVSAGSACSESSDKPSYVLLSMGYKEDEARSALRITLGKQTKKEEVEKTLKILEQVVEQLRKKK